MSAVAHFFMSVAGSKIHERLAHFFIDIYIQSGLWDFSHAKIKASGNREKSFPGNTTEKEGEIIDQQGISGTNGNCGKYRHLDQA